jgi:hypothetical protein
MKQGRGDADYSSIAQRYFPAPGQFVRPTQETAAESKPLPPAPKPVEGKPLEQPPIEETPTEDVPVAAAKTPKEEELPEGVNLSGGFRGWLTRRLARGVGRRN